MNAKERNKLLSQFIIAGLTKKMPKNILGDDGLIFPEFSNVIEENLPNNDLTPVKIFNAKVGGASLEVALTEGWAGDRQPVSNGNATVRATIQEQSGDSHIMTGKFSTFRGDGRVTKVKIKGSEGKLKDMALKVAR